jgi:hypothetical protein
MTVDAQARPRPQRQLDEPRRPEAVLRLAAWALSVWSVLYVAPHLYWAFGGDRGFSLLRPSAVELEEWAAINAVASVVLLIPVVIAVGLVRFRTTSPVKVALLGAALVGTSISAAHGIYGIVYRILNLGGVVKVDGETASISEHPWVLWDLILFEPWFLVEGLLFFAIGWAATSGSGRRRWVYSAVAGVAIATLSGVLGLRFA